MRLSAPATGSTRVATGEMSSSCRESRLPPRNLVTEMMAESSMSTRNLNTVLSSNGKVYRISSLYCKSSKKFLIL